VLKTNSKQGGHLTISDLELAGLLFLWLVMEDVCNITPGMHIALFSDNSPTVSWVQWLVARGSQVAGQLIRALALRLKVQKMSPLTPLHIAGKDNALTDVPSRSFGSELRWFCVSDNDLLTLFYRMFPLTLQNLWTNYFISFKTCTRVISVLRMKDSSMDE
jgi:hypothetical protein